MNTRNIVLILLACGLIALVAMVSYRKLHANNPKPQCYCSDLCGPRDVKPDDTPFIDPETGICFCKQRDKDNYKPHHCDTAEKVDFISHCDEQSKQ